MAEQAFVEFSFKPTSLEEAMKYATLIADSELVPKDYQKKPGNVLVAIQMGQELGLKPMQALQNISVVNGRPSVWGDLPLALVMGSGLVEDFREDLDEQTWIATCQTKRKGVPSPCIRHYSMDDAKKAGLWGKAGSWQTSPKRMLQLRARGFALRDTYPDVLKGLSIGEEQQDVVDVEAHALPDPPKIDPPRRLSDSNMAATESPKQEAALHPPQRQSQTGNGNGWRKITSKFDSKCNGGCVGGIKAGDEIYYHPTDKLALCPACYAEHETLF